MRALLAASVFALVALFGASCSVGTRTQGGSAQLVVTRDFGQKQLLSATEDPIEGSETVMRFLMRNARVKTRYGGRFVNAISGVDSKNGGGRRLDWFYYVNGIEAEVGAAERKLAGGDRVWWD